MLVDLWLAMLSRVALLDSNHADDDELTTWENGDGKGLRELLVDGLHLTGAGYKVFFDVVKPCVGESWAEEPVNNPSWVFP